MCTGRLIHIKHPKSMWRVLTFGGRICQTGLVPSCCFRKNSLSPTPPAHPEGTFFFFACVSPLWLSVSVPDIIAGKFEIQPLSLCSSPQVLWIPFHSWYEKEPTSELQRIINVSHRKKKKNGCRRATATLFFLFKPKPAAPCNTLWLNLREEISVLVTAPPADTV